MSNEIPKDQPIISSEQRTSANSNEVELTNLSNKNDKPSVTTEGSLKKKEIFLFKLEKKLRAARETGNYLSMLRWIQPYVYVDGEQIRKTQESYNGMLKSINDLLNKNQPELPLSVREFELRNNAAKLKDINKQGLLTAIYSQVTLTLSDLRNFFSRIITGKRSDQFVGFVATDTKKSTFSESIESTNSPSQTKAESNNPEKPKTYAQWRRSEALKEQPIINLPRERTLDFSDTAEDVLKQMVYDDPTMNVKEMDIERFSSAIEKELNQRIKKIEQEIANNHGISSIQNTLKDKRDDVKSLQIELFAQEAMENTNNKYNDKMTTLYHQRLELEKTSRLNTGRLTRPQGAQTITPKAKTPDISPLAEPTQHNVESKSTGSFRQSHPSKEEDAAQMKSFLKAKQASLKVESSHGIELTTISKPISTSAVEQARKKQRNRLGPRKASVKKKENPAPTQQQQLMNSTDPQYQEIKKAKETIRQYRGPEKNERTKKKQEEVRGAEFKRQ